MSDVASYWARRQLTRRRLIRGIGLGSGGLAALSLVGCGGNDSKDDSSSTGGGVEPPKDVDSTQGKPGGTFKAMVAAYMGSLSTIERADPTVQRVAGLTHSGLVGMKWGQESVAVTDYGVEPDLATALPEQAPDQLTYTFKLRPGVTFHNGKPLTSADVKYTFDKIATLPTSQFIRQWAVWYGSVETPDPMTVVLKTKFPYADTVEAMAAFASGFIVNKEFEESAEATSKMLGTGPFIWDSAQPPVSVFYKKNPNYHNKPYPYFDAVQLFATTDVEARISNFTSGQVHQPWINYPNDRDRVKQARPDAKIQTNQPYMGPAITMRTDQPPLNDKRVRQALSMAIDRKKINDATMKGEGQPDQMFPALYRNLYGTREVKDLGAAAKYWSYDPTTAKQLLSAAGVTGPIEMENTHFDASLVGSWLPDTATLVAAGWKELGIANLKLVTGPAFQLFGTLGIGQYNGVTTGISSGLSGLQRGLTLRNLFFSPAEGVRAPTTNTGYVNNQALNPLLDKQLGQFDAEARKATFRQIEDVFAEEQYRIVLNSTSQSWFWDPSLRNVRLPYEQAAARFYMRWWFA